MMQYAAAGSNDGIASRSDDKEQNEQQIGLELELHPLNPPPSSPSKSLPSWQEQEQEQEVEIDQEEELDIKQFTEQYTTSTNTVNSRSLKTASILRKFPSHSLSSPARTTNEKSVRYATSSPTNSNESNPQPLPPIRLPRPVHDNDMAFKDNLTLKDIKANIKNRNNRINANSVIHNNDNHNNNNTLQRGNIIEPTQIVRCGSQDSSISGENARHNVLSSVFPALKISTLTRSKIEIVRTSRLYGVIWFALLLILLFGDEVQDLTCTSTTDIIWDVVYCVTVVLLLADMVLVGFTSNHYFSWQYGAPTSTRIPSSDVSIMGHSVEPTRCTSDDSEFLVNPVIPSTHTTSANTTPTTKTSILQFRIGTMTFWFDLLSTLSLLIDISFLNLAPQWSCRHNIAYNDLEIHLDTAIHQGDSSINHSPPNHPIKPSLYLLISIFRSLRIFSLLQAHSLIEGRYRWNATMNKITEMKDERRIRKRINNLSELSTVSLSVVKNILRNTTNADNGGGGGGRRRSMMSEDVAAVKIQRACRYAWGFNIKSMHSVDNLLLLKGVSRRLLESVDGGRKRGRKNVDTNESNHIVTGHPGLEISLKEMLEEKVDGKPKVKRKYKMSLKEMLEESVDGKPKVEGKHKMSLKEMLEEKVDGKPKVKRKLTMSLKEMLEEKVDGKPKVERNLKVASSVRQKNTGVLAENGTMLSVSKRDLLINNSKPGIMIAGLRKKTQTDLLQGSIGTELTPSCNKDGAVHQNAYTSEVNKKSMLRRSTYRVTENKVGLGIILTFILMVVFTYFELDASSSQTMITLHNIERESSGFTTKNLTHVNRAVKVILSNTPNLYHYQFTNKTIYTNPSLPLLESQLRARERSQITICTANNATHATSCTCSIGTFDVRPQARRAAWASLLLTLSMMIFWWMAVIFYVVPVSGLLVIPIQRMSTFLGMLMKDPLGYQKTPEYHQFVRDEEGLSIRTGWSKEVMDGMETSFLMSTLTRISSLMKVGFGSAGVDIIRSNLCDAKDVHFQNLVGTTVSCIFVFGDIRSFTDASECLQEEVFVFTNRIASVVHSYCNSYGGAVNKNIGDAFLVSWRLDLTDNDDNNDSYISGSAYDDDVSSKKKLLSNDHQADRALLSVVRIFIALQYDNFYLKDMSKGAKKRLVKKMAERPGSLVQMGFGLHAGKAVQGAIGSERKLDATYISKAVDLSEYLECTTKKYSVNLLMSGEFHTLLAKGCQKRCRLIDQIKLKEDGGVADHDFFKDADDTRGDVMKLYTLDIVVEDMWRRNSSLPHNRLRQLRPSKSEKVMKSSLNKYRNQMRSSMFEHRSQWGNLSETNINSSSNDDEVNSPAVQGTVDLPSGPIAYHSSAWLKNPLRDIRRKYSDARFRAMFDTALKAYFAGDWNNAALKFELVDDLFDDNPSKYFLKKMKKTNCIPPATFDGYGSS